MYDSHYLFQKKMQREERNIIKSKGETDGEGGRERRSHSNRALSWMASRI